MAANPVIDTQNIQPIKRHDVCDGAVQNPNYIRTDKFTFNPGNALGFDSTTLANRQLYLNQTNVSSQIINALQNNYYNYVKTLDAYLYTMREKVDTCDCSPENEIDENDNTAGSSSTGSSASTASSTDNSLETALDALQGWEEAVDNLIDAFDPNGEVDYEKLEAFQSQVEAYCNRMMALAILISAKQEMHDTVNEILTGVKPLTAENFIDAIQNYTNNRLQMASTLVMDRYQTKIDELQAKYEEEKARIEDEYSGICANEKNKLEEMETALQEYENELTKIADSMESVYGSSIDTASFSTEDLSAVLDDKLDQLYVDSMRNALAETETTDNGYYDVAAAEENFEEARGQLTSAQNISRCLLVLSHGKQTIYETAYRTLTGNEGPSSKDSLVDAAFENKYAAQTTKLENVISLKFQAIQTHNEKIYTEKQIEKLEKQKIFKVAAWICRGLSLVITIASIVGFIIPGVTVATTLISLALNVAASAFEYAGAKYADNQVDDELSMTVTDRDEDESTGLMVDGIPATGAQEEVMDHQENQEYVTGDDDLFYLDTTQTASYLAELNGIQNSIRALNLLSRARQNLTNQVQAELTGVSLGDNSTLVDAAYESNFRQYLFMFQARSFIKDQSRSYQNSETIQEQNLKKALNNFWISAVCSTAGTFFGGGLITTVFGGAIGTAAGALGSLLSSWLNNDWAFNFNPIEIHNTFNYSSRAAESDNNIDMYNKMDQLDAEEQSILQEYLYSGFISTSINGFGMSYDAVNPATTAIAQQALTKIQNMRMLLVILYNAKQQLYNTVKASLTGNGAGTNNHSTIIQTILAQNSTANQQLNYVTNLKNQQCEINNRAADARQDFYQQVITSGITFGIAGIGVGVALTASNAVNIILATFTGLANLSGSICQIIFTAIEKSRAAEYFDDLDPEALLLKLIDEQQETSDSKISVSENEMEVLTQITTDLINSLDYGMWGVNAGVSSYFSNQMEKLYRAEEVKLILSQMKSNIRSIVSQILTGTPEVSRIDASSILAADKAKAMTLVSAMFSCLEMITDQHNQMLQAERELYLSFVDAAVTIIQSAIQISAAAQEDQAKKIEKVIKNSQALIQATQETYQNTPVENTAVRQRLEQAYAEQNAILQNKYRELTQLGKKINRQMNMESLIGLGYPWVRIVAGYLVDRALTNKYNKTSTQISVAAGGTDTLDTMENARIAALLEQGAARQSQMESAVNFNRQMEIFDTIVDSVEKGLLYLSKVLTNKKNQNVADIELTQYDEKCDLAQKSYRSVVDGLHQLSAMLNLPAEAEANLPKTIDNLRDLYHRVQELQRSLAQQIKAADAQRAITEKYASGNASLPVFAAQATMLQFQRQLQQSTTALEAYLDLLEQQTATPAKDAPTNPTAQKKQKEAARVAAQNAQANLVATMAAASRLADNEVITHGLSKAAATKLTMEQIAEEAGQPISEMTEAELLEFIASQRQKRQTLIEGKSGDGIATDTNWEAIGDISTLINVALSFLRKKITERLLTEPADHANFIRSSMPEDKRYQRINREMDAVLKKYCNPKTSSTTGTSAATSDAPATSPTLRSSRAIIQTSQAFRSQASLVAEQTDVEKFAVPPELTQALATNRYLLSYIPQKQLQSAQGNLIAMLKLLEEATAKQIAAGRETAAKIEAANAVLSGNVETATKIAGLETDSLRDYLRSLLVLENQIRANLDDNTSVLALSRQTIEHVTGQIEALETRRVQLASNYEAQRRALSEKITQLKSAPLNAADTASAAPDIAALQIELQKLKTAFNTAQKAINDTLNVLKSRQQSLQVNTDHVAKDSSRLAAQLNTVKQDIETIRAALQAKTKSNLRAEAQPEKKQTSASNQYKHFIRHGIEWLFPKTKEEKPAAATPPVRVAARNLYRQQTTAAKAQAEIMRGTVS